MANSRLHSSEEIIPIIHRALVEITALKEANLPLRIDKNASSPTHEYMYHVARGAGFQSSHGGEVSLKFDHEDLRQAILEYIQPSESPGEVAVSGDEEQVENALAEESVEDEAPPDAVVGENTASTGALESSDAAESEGPMASEPLLEEVDDSQPIQDSNSYVPKDRNWRRVSLADPEIKFAVSTGDSWAYNVITDIFPGAQARHAAHWQTHSRPRYRTYSRSQNIAGSSCQKAKAKEACGSPVYQQSHRSAKCGGSRTQVYSN